LTGLPVARRPTEKAPSRNGAAENWRHVVRVSMISRSARQRLSEPVDVHRGRAVGEPRLGPF
jgi:hypothetical protein